MELIELLKKDGFAIQPIQGDSMMPLLDQTQDAVKLVPFQENFQIGDVPLYRRPDGKLVLHRIVGLKKRYVLTRGDNRRTVEIVPKSWIVAKMQGYYKGELYTDISDTFYQKYVNETIGKKEPWQETEYAYCLSLLVVQTLIQEGKYVPHVAIHPDAYFQEKTKQEIQSKGKFVTLICHAFPSFSSMKERYPVLHTIPIFLPLLWIIRLIKMASGKANKAERSLFLETWKENKKRGG